MKQENTWRDIAVLDHRLSLGLIIKTAIENQQQKKHVNRKIIAIKRIGIIFIIFMAESKLRENCYYYSKHNNVEQA